MSSKIDKDMLKNPDLFISTSDKIFNYIEHHFKTAVTLLGLVFFAGVGYVAYGYVTSAKEQKAAEALYQPEAGLRKAENDIKEQQAKVAREKQINEAKVDIKGVKKAKKEAPLPERTVDFAKDYGSHVDAIKAQLRQFAGTKAALVSALNLSYFLAQQKKYDMAAEVLEIPTYHPKPGELLGGFWYMHRGGILLENQKVEPAIDSFQSVVNSPALKPFHPEALLKLGICFEIKGDAEKARTTYEKISRDFPETEASSFAQQYLRLLELKTAKQG